MGEVLVLVTNRFFSGRDKNKSGILPYLIRVVLFIFSMNI
ncbi:hypothetical protein D931_01026 [Enterococcus faecium 13.SD.W.09]|nr:hypothetical protein D931_01026 [Enterococcus faecium 13.SD.W.09]